MVRTRKLDVAGEICGWAVLIIGVAQHTRMLCLKYGSFGTTTATSTYRSYDATVIPAGGLVQDQLLVIAGFSRNTTDFAS